MGDAWFTEVADELARCLVDARAAAETCEAFLESIRTLGDGALRRRAVDALVGPAAVSYVLIELIDHPPELVLAAARLCRETSAEAAAKLDELGHSLDSGETVAALRRSADSCARLLDASQ